MEFLRLLLRYLHLVGFALLVGAWAAQYLTGKLRVNVLMRTGLGTMISTGLLGNGHPEQRLPRVLERLSTNGLIIRGQRGPA